MRQQWNLIGVDKTIPCMTIQYLRVIHQTDFRSLIPRNLNIILGPYNSSLQATLDHHGNYMHHSHYTTSVKCCGKSFFCNDDKITECDIINRRNLSTIYILFYKLIVECPWPDRERWEFINSHGVGTLIYPINHRSGNRRRNRWSRQYVSSW